MSDPLSEASADRKVLVADEGAAGRIDAWLAGKLGDAYSRSRIKALIKEGAVTVNGVATVDPHRSVKTGDSVEIAIPEPEELWGEARVFFEKSVRERDMKFMNEPFLMGGHG